VIMTSSARSFSERWRSKADFESSSGSAKRGRVPLMGRVSISRPEKRRKVSGEEERISRPARLR